MNASGVAILLLGLLISGCMSTSTDVTGALHKVTAQGVDSADMGSVTVSESGDKLTIEVAVKAGGLTPGEHGIHIHQNPDCGAGPASATNATVIAAGKAGGHLNPSSAKHGGHAGDLGNINAASDGSATASITSFKAPLTLKSGDDYSVRGRSIVIHAQRDDGVTDPSGNSGGRVLCAVILA